MKSRKEHLSTLHVKLTLFLRVCLLAYTEDVAYIINVYTCICFLTKAKWPKIRNRVKIVFLCLNKFPLDLLLN